MNRIAEDNSADVLGLGFKPGDGHYRAYVGPPADYDLVAAMTFNLLAALGCRQQHRVLDVGCGSLRVGRLLIPYLNVSGYAGIEPNGWLIRDGIEREVGEDQVRIKQPRFHVADNAGDLIREGARFDFVIAQSIFSHCGPDMLEHWLSQFASLLDDGGTAVVTYIEGPDTEATGWIYPGCVSFSAGTMGDLAGKHGLAFTPLRWKHPRQQWALLARPGFDIARFKDQPLGWNESFDWVVSRKQKPATQG